MPSTVCNECHDYAVEAEDLCGNCLLKAGKHVEDFDPVLRERKAIRDAELKSGKLNSEEIELAILTAKLAKLDRPPPVLTPGMHPKGHIDPQEPSVSVDNLHTEAAPRKGEHSGG